MTEMLVNIPWQGLVAIVVIGTLVVLFISYRVVYETFFTIEQQTVGVIQRFGKFVRIAHPGLNIKIPFIEEVAKRINLRIYQLDVEVETKTKDDVFATIKVSVQHYVLKDKVYEFCYKLRDPNGQMKSYVFDVVRARVPKLNLNDVFETKDEIARSIKDELDQVMDDFGLGILHVENGVSHHSLSVPITVLYLNKKFQK